MDMQGNRDVQSKSGSVPKHECRGLVLEQETALLGFFFAWGGDK